MASLKETFPAQSTKWGSYPTSDSGALGQINILDNGRVALLATYGSDTLIADAARVSYGKGTVRTNSDGALIRYLMRHRHTSPFEQAEVTFYLRIPIFIARQLVRHRTANLNEYSARYSELSDDAYLPNADHLGTQSVTNKQGRVTNSLLTSDVEKIQLAMMNSHQSSMNTYRSLIDEHKVSRELARIVTPVSTYTEMYWKCDVHNFLHFLKLRMDGHAQQEIQDMANAMHDLVAPFFPITFAAWDDYIQNSYTLSAMEQKLLAHFLHEHIPAHAGAPHNLFGMSEREYREFCYKLDEWRS